MPNVAWQQKHFSGEWSKGLLQKLGTIESEGPFSQTCVGLFITEASRDDAEPIATLFFGYFGNSRYICCYVNQTGAFGGSSSPFICFRRLFYAVVPKIIPPHSRF